LFDLLCITFIQSYVGKITLLFFFPEK